ncbi:hypothetical protein BDV33DRAFT_210716 [Aspergillus novoparasiticus]|uniref:Transmembrane protein n=1 Tax=Aspergillus novoparasiticus TaxID=986946 RepID=A0A5N6E817_9EURO|nr:hypothetical protein BDV33DRAFT_210716 [Aspergillus novoparasiticus]
MSVTLQVVVLSVLIWAACGALGFWSYYNRSMLWLGFTFHISKWAALIISSLFMVMNIWLAVRRVDNDSQWTDLNIILVGALFSVFNWIEIWRCESIEFTHKNGVKKTLSDVEKQTLSRDETAKHPSPVGGAWLEPIPPRWPLGAVARVVFLVGLLCCELAYGFLDDLEQVNIMLVLIAGYCVLYLSYIAVYINLLLSQQGVDGQRHIWIVILPMGVTVIGVASALIAESFNGVQHLFCVFVVSEPITTEVIQRLNR